MYLRLSEAEKHEIWEQLRAGVSFRTIARKLGRSSATVRDYVAATGGVRPSVRARRTGSRQRHLSARRSRGA